MNRDPEPEDEAILREFAENHFPQGAGPTMQLATCMFTNTPDEHFVITRPHDYDNVTVACGFSGHGFKFVPVVGEIVADLVADGATPHPIGLFDPTRPALRAEARSAGPAPAGRSGAPACGSPRTPPAR